MFQDATELLIPPNTVRKNDVPVIIANRPITEPLENFVTDERGEPLGEIIVFPIKYPPKDMDAETIDRLNQAYDACERFMPNISHLVAVRGKDNRYKLAVTTQDSPPLYLADAVIPKNALQKVDIEIFPDKGTNQSLSDKQSSYLIRALLPKLLEENENDFTVGERKLYQYVKTLIQNSNFKANYNTESRSEFLDDLYNRILIKATEYCESEQLFNPRASVKVNGSNYIHRIETYLNLAILGFISPNDFITNIFLEACTQLDQQGAAIVGQLIQQSFRDLTTSPRSISVLMGRLSILFSEEDMDVFEEAMQRLVEQIDYRWGSELYPNPTWASFKEYWETETGNVCTRAHIDELKDGTISRERKEQIIIKRGLLFSDEEANSYVVFPVGKLDGFHLAYRDKSNGKKVRERICKKLISNEPLEKQEAEILYEEIVGGNIRISILESKAQLTNQTYDTQMTKDQIEHEMSHYILMVFRQLINHNIIDLNSNDSKDISKVRELLKHVDCFGSIIEWEVLSVFQGVTVVFNNTTIEEVDDCNVDKFVDFYRLDPEKLLNALYRRFKKIVTHAREAKERNEILILSHESQA